MSTLSRIAYEWAERCFGSDHVEDLPLRSLRTVEEAIELCQSFGVPKNLVLLAVETVYSRPVGEPEQEMGGVLHTMNILCESMGVEPDEIAERELRRCLQKSPEHFAKRNQEKLDLGLDASAQSSGDLPHTADAYADIARDARYRADAKARAAYQASVDNGPIHSNRCPTWDELTDEVRNGWRAAVGQEDDKS